MFVDVITILRVIMEIRRGSNGLPGTPLPCIDQPPADSGAPIVIRRQGGMAVSNGCVNGNDRG